MNEEKEMKNFEEDETDELSIEEITEVQGGIEGVLSKDNCGLGCFLGTGYGGSPINH